MSVKYSFFDNQLIGVDDLNKITSRFVTEGVAREISSVNDLNDYVSDVATKGVVPESCDSLKVEIKDGMITINKGTAIFSDGTVIELSEAESFPHRQDVKQYVCLISDKASNSAYADVLETEPSFDVALVLAIVENDKITDKRVYSRGKLAYYASADVNNNVYIEERDIQLKYKANKDGYMEYRININADMYKFIQILDLNSFNFTRYNVKDKSFLSFGYGYYSYYALNEEYMVVASQRERRCICEIVKGEGYVTFRFKMESPNYIIPLSLRFEFIA